MSQPEELLVARLSHDEFNFGDWTAEDLGVNGYVPGQDEASQGADKPEPDKNIGAGNIDDLVPEDEKPSAPIPASTPKAPPLNKNSNVTPTKSSPPPAPKPNHRRKSPHPQPQATPTQNSAPPTLQETAETYGVSGMSLDEQLAFNSQIMRAMGLVVPNANLSPEQYDKLAERHKEVASEPGLENYRLIAAPLFPSGTDLLKNREDMLRTLVNNGMASKRFLDSRNSRWSISSGSNNVLERATDAGAYTHYADNLEVPDKDVVGPDNTRLCWRYKANDKLLKRDQYLNYLHSSEQAVEGENGTLWTYDFVDVSTDLPHPRSSQTVRELIGLPANTPTNSPEREIAVRGIHVIGGHYTFDPTGGKKLNNEGLAGLLRQSVARYAGYVGMSSGGYDHRVRLGGIRVELRPASADNYAIRGSVSGL